MNLIDELIETLELMLNPNSADLGIKLFLERDFDNKEFPEVLIIGHWIIDSTVIFTRWFRFRDEELFACVYATKKSNEDIPGIIEKLKQLRNEINIIEKLKELRNEIN